MSTEPKIKEINGDKYSTTQFPGYNFRAKAEGLAGIAGKVGTFDIYTTATDRKKAQGDINTVRKFATIVNIIHWSSKKQDEMIAKLIDELGWD